MLFEYRSILFCHRRWTTAFMCHSVRRWCTMLPSRRLIVTLRRRRCRIWRQRPRNWTSVPTGRHSSSSTTRSSLCQRSSNSNHTRATPYVPRSRVLLSALPLRWYCFNDLNLPPREIWIDYFQVCEVSAEKPVREDLLERFKTITDRLHSLKLENDEARLPVFKVNCGCLHRIVVKWIVYKIFHNDYDFLEYWIFRSGRPFRRPTSHFRSDFPRRTLTWRRSSKPKRKQSWGRSRSWS